MKNHDDLVQGTPEWHAHRRQYRNASDAPAMMGCSPHESRTELMDRLKTGITRDVDAGTQKRFDDGHLIEALIRPLGADIVGRSLYPVVGTLGELSASFDGLTMDESIDLEVKTLNNELRAVFSEIDTMAPEYRESRSAGEILPLHYRVQMEQQLLVADAEKCLFMAGDLNADKTGLNEVRHCWYYPDLELRAAIVAGWAQLDEELATHVPAEIIVPALAAPQIGLPAVSIQVNGSIKLVDNLEKFGVALNAYIDKLNRKPETDQDFANLEDAVKRLKVAEEQLDAAESGALGQVESVDTMRKTVALHRETARTTRLLVEKLVKAEKENRKTAIVSDAVAEFHTHITGLNTRLGKNYMPVIQADFQGVIKGLKSIDSMRDKVKTELARVKIEANATADKIQANLTTLRELAKDHAFLFADTGTIVLKANDDLTALVKSRIADHQAAEAKRLEDERAKIRAEEQEKAAREQREALEAEDALIASLWANARRIEFDSVPYIKKAIAMFETGAKDWENDPRPRVASAVAQARAEMKGKLESAQASEVAQQIIDANAQAQANIEEARKADALPAPILDALSDVGNALMADAVATHAINTASRPAVTLETVVRAVVPTEIADKLLPPASTVIPFIPVRSAPASPPTPPTLKLGDIGARLAPIAISGAGLSQLGFEPSAINQNSRLYYEHEFPLICAAIVAHVEAVQGRLAA